jgi:hypothetical protein
MSFSNERKIINEDLNIVKQIVENRGSIFRNKSPKKSENNL